MKRHPIKVRAFLLAALALSWLLAVLATPARAAGDAECVKCHPAAATGKFVHAAVEMGCATCHGPLDASVVPHRGPAKFPKALNAEPPALCASCHEAGLFEGRVVHAPVGSGQCLGCHDPHASRNLGLLRSAPAQLCLDCHPEVAKAPHVVAGITRSGHPLGNEAREVEDPLRPGRTYYCAGCHEPHRSQRDKLVRFDKGMASCQKCHRM